MTDDFAVIGAGIVGLATATQILEQRPGSRVVVLEKEDRVAVHQTGRNSGVIHSGIYYHPNSLKAKLCRAGAAATRVVAEEHGIPVHTCGKLLVATSRRELALMDDLASRAQANGVSTERLDGAELTRREPAIRGLGALLVEQGAVVDYGLIAAALAARIRSSGGAIEFGVKVTGIVESSTSVRVDAGQRSWTVRKLAVCAGLQADRLARMAGANVDFQIVPFRGEYYRLRPERNRLITHLIYPIPDPVLPFLGVHLTRTPDGGVTVGPNAVLGLSREGYRRGAINLRDVAEYARFPGTWRVARAHLRTGLHEVRNSVFRRAYLAECRRFCPELTVGDLMPKPAGIRAQAVLRDGTLVQDFLFAETPHTLHVCNAPSPAATSALPIARHVVDRLLAS